MTYKFLLSVSLTSLSLIGAIAPSVSAQERPKCYLIDNSGQITNLTDICNASQRTTPVVETATNEGLNIINNNRNVIGSEPLASDLSLADNVYFLGEGSAPVDLNSIGSSYYIDKELGIDYAAYIRRYRTSPTSLPRQAVKEQVFQFDVDVEPDNLTSIIRRGQSRTPFLIYRYPVR